MKLCKGGCKQKVKFGKWCKAYPFHCPNLRAKFNKRRIKNISNTKKYQAKMGLNPMQNPEICKKNHSIKRNKKAAETLRNLGKSGLLPQQTESIELKDKRRKNVSLTLKRLYLEGTHPRQRETSEERKSRIGKMTIKLKKLGKEGKLPVQNMTEEEKRKIGKKISDTLLLGIRSGRIKLSHGWKQVPYNNLILRSYWEKTVAEFLDKNGLKWEYETLRVDYWDSVRNINAVTIPDFFIPSMNTIIEVKSNGMYRAQNTRDKMIGIKKHGFNAILAGKNEIELIKNNPDKFLSYLREGKNEKS